jgi:hypothetical protein
MRGVNLEIYRLPVYTLVASGDSCGFRFDFPLHFDEVIPTPSRNVMKLGPFLISREARGSTGRLWFCIAISSDVDEL